MNDVFFSRSTRKVNPRRAFSSSSTRSFPWKRIGILVGSVLGIGGSLFACSRFLRIQNIDCTFEDQSCTDAQWQTARTLQGRFFFSPLHLSLPGKKVIVKRSFPTTVQVHIQGEQILIRVATNEQGENKRSIHTDGSVGDVEPQSTIATGSADIRDLTLERSAQAGHVPFATLEVYKTLLVYWDKITLQYIVVREKNLIELHIRDTLVAIASADDLASQLRSLQAILSSHTIEEKPARVDLRFSRPVLHYL